ncbi:MAG: tRNA (adenosine(37)-N6)-threonylcarbamoyltransferase complex ATPase subunit type 1 TsaE [Planctomycetota bacterium]|nr:tRNA (adenosine(37)-N6)-threonylcarbamoyltransferase complex ATPase subunit type 1 TsaE [Planctomycetota bacterium]
MSVRPHPRRVLSEGPERTAAMAERLAAAVPAGTVISLVGNLGAGKTVFAAGLARGLGCLQPVLSPSFVLLRVYRGGRLPLYHLDAWRLPDAAAASGSGAEEFLPGDGVTVIEWGDRLADILPRETLVISIEHGERPNERFLSWSSRDPAILAVADGCWLPGGY